MSLPRYAPLAAAIGGLTLNLLLAAAVVLVDFGSSLFVPTLLVMMASPIISGIAGLIAGALLIARGEQDGLVKAGIALSLLLLLAGAAEIAGLVYLNTHGSSMLLFMIA